MNQAVKNRERQDDGRELSVIDISKKGRQLLRSRRYAEAQKLFQLGLEKEPENPYLLSGMGDACRERGHLTEAERCYRLLLEVDSKNLFALRGLGDVCKKLNRHHDAILQWEKYISLRPQDKFVMSRIADSYKVLQQYAKAEEVYHQILKFATEDRFALTGLADLQHQLGKDEQAIATYERVLKFDENELHILTIIGKLCWRISDFDRAESYFRRALQVDPNNPYALYGLGNCYRWRRQYAQALEIWQKILEHSDGTQSLHTRMGDAHFHLGQLDKAENCYRRSLTFGDDVFATAALVCLSCQREDWSGATGYFWQLIAMASAYQSPLELLVKRFEQSAKQKAMVTFFTHLLAEKKGEPAVLAALEEQLKQYC